ncbi:MAG: hypothetical protein ACLP7J_19525, partial [Streptosporangiaceae bacterium]
LDGAGLLLGLGLLLGDGLLLFVELLLGLGLGLLDGEEAADGDALLLGLGLLDGLRLVDVLGLRLGDGLLEADLLGKGPLVALLPAFGLALADVLSTACRWRAGRVCCLPRARWSVSRRARVPDRVAVAAAVRVPQTGPAAPCAPPVAFVTAPAPVLAMAGPTRPHEMMPAHPAVPSMRHATRHELIGVATLALRSP